ncbi:hypothetical protein L226DRAFT_511473 [Lentinus tigrinus ALCF2SS1-7]|uniref:BTB domain-containing protein n=1 Tax=Lentinus tigrinus ALCF2SS1-6 TaxID=1328759 RepID=A0A5C2S4R6_9APHY|nr:hypothetical protein L227DRAFT_550396 [Lentinus tigrinus ALCF2SS1-6]RPD72771.1 hypothetical protein L226DRAFT_511473 [Lentinus tigrinus ALCF2SS1-7]
MGTGTRAKRVRFYESDEDIKPELPSQSRDHSDHSGPEAYERDEEFWFADGNFILVVRTTGFRLYMGLLSAQSSILRHLLSHVAPDGGSEGTQVVHIATDSPRDWRYLLRRLFPKGNGTSRSSNDFPMICALFRLSHKYQLTDVMEYAKSALKDTYSNDYDTWRIHDSHVHRMDSHSAQRTAVLSQAIVAIRFARLFNIPSVLPAAFYHCACLGGAIARGYTHEDGATEYLPPDDLERCINGMQTLVAATADYVPRLLKYMPAHKTCKKGGACRRLWKLEVTEKLTKAGRQGSTSSCDLFERFPALNGLCSNCKKKAEDWEASSFEGKQKKLWKDLPVTFGVAHLVKRRRVEGN